MSFTYDFSTALILSQVRMLIPDVDPTKPIFSDDEINQAIYLTSSQGIYVSSQAQTTAASVNPTPLVYSVRLAAAMLIDVIASSKAKLGIVEQILDVKLAPGKAQAALHAQAEALREQEDNLGSFAIAEIVYDSFSARERWLNQMLRLEGI